MPAFTVNHNVLVPGLYLSGGTGKVSTFLRFKKPNTGDRRPMPLHSVELYESPPCCAIAARGCRDLFRPHGLSNGLLLPVRQPPSTDAGHRPLRRCSPPVRPMTAPCPAKAAECGNYRNLDAALARACCAPLRGRDPPLDTGGPGLSGGLNFSRKGRKPDRLL